MSEKRATSIISGAVAAATVILCACVSACASASEPVTAPDVHLGRPVGVDFELADWNEVSSYYRRLGEESPRVVTRSIGTTTEGRDFLVSVVSSEANLARVDEIRAAARILADPRDRTDAEKQAAIEDGRLILFVSCAMHSTETAGAQFGMEFAHRLATSDEEPWRSARDEIVTVIFTTNPDGVDHVVEWYRETVGTPHEASGLLKLYQYYSGHDNNRDWFMLTQAETRLVTRMLYKEWFPQVYWDVHQQGSKRERFFVPPFRDPLNPNLDPNIITGIDALGSRALMDMTREELSGISTGVSYDMWWNGGNRNVPVRHNIIGLLTEAASVRIASPVFLPKADLSPPRGIETYAPSNRFPLPWPGGWWRLRDIIDYEMAFGRSLLASLSRERRYWMRNGLDAAERTIRLGRDDAPRAWLIPSDNRDPAAVRRLVEVLLLSGVEIDVTDADLSADGRRYPAGSIVIQRDQPYGAHVKDLFDVQRYPGGEPPYDVAGWTLPFLLGVRRVEVIDTVDAPLRRVESADAALAAFSGDPRLAGAAPDVRSLHDSGVWPETFSGLAAGRSYRMLTGGAERGLLEPASPESDAARGDGGIFGIEGFASSRAVVLDRLPRIGVYAPWSGSMDEGWTRYVLDTFEVPYATVRNEMMRAGALGEFLDVLIIPSIGGAQLDGGRPDGSVPSDYTRGLAPEGAVAVEEFVRGGGTLITFGRSCRWAIDLLRLPLVDVTSADGAEGFACPGSVLRGIPHADHPLTAGLPDSLALFFSRSSAFRAMTEDERAAAKLDAVRTDVLLRYAPTRVLLSGWIREPETIANQGGWVRAEYGRGRVHLFGFRPQYRGWSQGTFGLIFRAAVDPLRSQ